MPRIKTQNGDVLEEVQQHVYDTYDLAAAQDPSKIGVISFFSAVQGKPLSQTNLKQNNMLESKTSFRCTGMALLSQTYAAGNVLVLPTLMEKSYLQFNVGTKAYWEGNASQAAGRIYQVSAMSGQAAPGTERSLVSLGAPAARSVAFSRLHVVDIEELTSFNVKWGIEGLSAADIGNATPAANSPVRFICTLYGLMRRAVQ